MKLSWNWLCEYVKVKDAPEAVSERLTLAGLEVKSVDRVGSDYVLETEVTSNRPDWLSHIGVAREIAALYGKSLMLPKVKIDARKINQNISKVIIKNPEACSYYSCAEIIGIKKTQTPTWMKERLEVCGIRSINFLVDVTNYVLLETGQPLHAFDLDLLKSPEVEVRTAQENEKFLAIDNNTYELKSGDVVIANGKRAIALGGVMGGGETEVSLQTKNILLESAIFNPSHIRKTSRQLKLFSESSYRFERGVDPLGVDFARNRAAGLISEHAGVEKIGAPIFSGHIKFRKTKIQLNISEIGKILGPVAVSVSKAKQILNALGIPTKTKGKSIVSEPPSFRPDISIKEDLVEEIARIYGYDRIPETIPSASLEVPKIDPVLELADSIRTICEGAGLQETVTFSIVNPQEYKKFESPSGDWVQIENPRNQNVTLMRPSLVQSLVEVVGRNITMGNRSVAIFEIANSYHQTDQLLPREDKILAVAMTGHKPASYLEAKRVCQFSDLKGVIEWICKKNQYESPKFSNCDSQHEFYPKDYSYSISVGEKRIGFCGLLKPAITSNYRIEDPVYYAEINLNSLSSVSRAHLSYRDISKYPLVERDLSLILDESIQVSEVTEKIESLGKGLIRHIKVFDLYRSSKLPKGKKSIAFRIEYQSYERTLSAVEVNELHFSIINELSKQFKAELPTKAQ